MSNQIEKVIQINIPAPVLPVEVTVGWMMVREPKTNVFDFDRNARTGEEWITVGATMGIAGTGVGEHLTINDLDVIVTKVSGRYRVGRDQLVDIYVIPA